MGSIKLVERGSGDAQMVRRSGASMGTARLNVERTKGQADSPSIAETTMTWHPGQRCKGSC